MVESLRKSKTTHLRVGTQKRGRKRGWDPIIHLKGIPLMKQKTFSLASPLKSSNTSQEDHTGDKIFYIWVFGGHLKSKLYSSVEYSSESFCLGSEELGYLSTNFHCFC
jgi:hypothetical protein